MADFAALMVPLQLQLASLLVNVTTEFAMLEAALANSTGSALALGSQLANISSMVANDMGLVTRRVDQLGLQLSNLEARLVRFESEESAREAREISDDKRLGNRLEVQFNMLKENAGTAWWDLASSGKRCY